mmetsp:Transcript_2511/g.3695  ORF Transcript_2511/g.3695 Transcript_2511/m.3695 type:complete len:354 (-) Transcript_2511:86-1147(-)|eukprot:CAMPEP_0171462402 /NCGR_PEP_ID=MMETSP0945-20130129/6451_1 /TAXON_ID=109269 /ORGANISM="Vaucheria litorea, Strain CCMP2940" /LENGTH=353 /DNA_ID=CAMNT_0011988915 /DNA_START=75 /DNA_END=1136 /DNA_ORIENTATION=-
MGNHIGKWSNSLSEDWREFFRQTYSHPKKRSANKLKMEGVNFDKDFQLEALVGIGSFSQVYKARHKISNSMYAAKLVLKSPSRPYLDDQIKQEIWILKILNHPSVVHFCSVYNEPERWVLVFELMEGGELFDRIVEKLTYNESEARDLVRILLGALTYIHSQHIVHRDLKPENLLMLSYSNDYQVKIADFGFARSVKNGVCTEYIGTPGYAAPEVVRKNAYSLPADVWSLGVIFFILLSGHAPFHDPNLHRLNRKIKTGIYAFNPEDWSTVSDEAKDLVKRMLTVDQMKRITAKEALDHPWFVGNRHRPDLINRNLTTNLNHLRMFNARRKFQGAVRSVLFAKRMDDALIKLS